MIRYPVTPAELETRIDAINDTWRDRASKRTAKFRKIGSFDEKTSIWSEIKAAYMSLQFYGSRRTQSDDYRTLASEQPLLIYPLGDIDDDPEDLITFIGITPIPKRRSGYKYYRARVTIDMFELEGREELRRQRAVLIQSMMYVLDSIEKNGDAQLVAEARDIVETAKAPSSPHSSCVRAFHALYQQNRQAANEIFREICNFLKSLS